MVVGQRGDAEGAERQVEMVVEQVDGEEAVEIGAAFVFLDFFPIRSGQGFKNKKNLP